MTGFYDGKVFGVPVDGMDRQFLGDDGDNQVVLVVEEGVPRIYTYEYSYEPDFLSDSRDSCDEYFYSFEGYLNRDSLGYVELEFRSIEDTIKEITEACRDLTNKFYFFEENLAVFLEKHKKELFPTEKIYAYYK